jgi:hypothetical protein
MAITQDIRSKLAQIALRSAFPAINGPVEKLVNDEVGSEKEPEPSAPSISTGTKTLRSAPSTEKARRSECLSAVNEGSSRVKQSVVHPTWCQGQRCCAFNQWKGRCNHEKAGIEGFAGMPGCRDARRRMCGHGRLDELALCGFR